MAVTCRQQLCKESATTQSQQYIVIHNSAGGTAKTVADYFKQCCGPNPEKGRSGVCAHYSVDHQEIVQILKDNWHGQHTKGNGHYAAWGSGLPVGTCTNSNSIGIEIADGSSVDFNKATDNCIELVRYLMKQYNIPIENVVRHGDTQNKPCPATTMKKNLWNSMLDTIKTRNDSNTPIAIDTSSFTCDGTMVNTPDGTSGGGGGIGGTINLVFPNDSHTTVQESLPNANTSDNWVDMHKIKGITLHMYPPYHNCSVDGMKKYFEYYNWDRAFHYKVDYDTEVDYSKKVPSTSGPFTGGNTVGSSISDVVLVPGEGVFSGVAIGGGGTVTGDTSGSAGGAGTINGNDVPSKIYNFCSGQGCSKAACCGIIANCEIESGFSTTIVNKSSGATGLFQWLGGRLTALKSKAQQAGKDWTDADIQIQHMWDEFTGEESTTVSLLNKRCGGIEGFKAITDPYKAGYEFGRCFERGGGNETRGNKAKEWFSKVDSMISSGGGSSSDNNNSSGNNSGGNSGGNNPGLPVTPASFSTRNVKPLTFIDPEVSGIMYGWPLPEITKVSYGYGYRECVYHGRVEMHAGIDIVAPEGERVRAYATGTIVEARKDDVFGYVIKMKHADGCYTYYAHLEGIDATVNQTITAGEVIGRVGHTGETKGDHLHFELWIDDEAVNPLLYVDVGGGYKKIPKCFKQHGIKSIGAYEDNVVKDNIDRSKICFACADNNQHTYIDRALFNNQNPKYTVSVAAFFDQNVHSVEKDKKYDWESVERNLVKQCAQALYFEGFTADNLWREFDLNRAPSPFVYLDRNRWKKFLVEVDKQVDWLNKKYGKVTGTYVPYNLLTNTNLNEFIELSPDLGMNGNVIAGGNGTNGSGGAGLTSADGGFWLGDSLTVGMKANGLLDNQEVVATGGWAARHYYTQKYGIKVDKTSMFPKPDGINYVFVLLGVNDPTPKFQKELLDKLISMYPGKPIFVGEVLPVGKSYSYSSKWGSENSASLNPKIKTYNADIQSYCSSNNNLYWVPTTAGMLDGEYLNSKLSIDEIHLTKEGYTKLVGNITSGITGSGASTGDTSNNGNNNSGGNTGGLPVIPNLPVTPASYEDDIMLLANKPAGDAGSSGSTPEDDTNTGVEIQQVKANPANINKYAYVADDASVSVYKKADTASDVVTSLEMGDEALILDIAAEFYYKIKANNITGYVPASTLHVISTNKFGAVDTKKQDHECWIRYNDTSLYNSTSMSGTVATVDAQTRCKVIEIDDKNGFYKVTVLDDPNKGKSGWVKAYRITFNKHEFTFDQDNASEDVGMLVEDIDIKNPDFEGEPINPTPSTPPGGNTGGGTGDTGTGSGEFSNWVNEVHKITNEQRARVGASALTLNSKLCDIAYQKSKDQNDKKYFDHKSPTYGMIWDQLKSNGMDYKTCGENIAIGQTSPKEVCQGWWDSPGHHANIVNKEFTQLGVGVCKVTNTVVDPEDGDKFTEGYIWTQVFFTPASGTRAASITTMAFTMKSSSDIPANCYLSGKEGCKVQHFDLNEEDIALIDHKTDLKPTDTPPDDSSDDSNNTEDTTTDDTTNNNTSSEPVSKYPNVQKTTGSLENWDEEGNVEFLLVPNAEFGEEGRWRYRGNFFARIRSFESALAGIKQEFDTTVMKSDTTNSDTEDTEDEDTENTETNKRESTDEEFALRVSAWIKLVTSDDEPGAIDPDAAESYIEDGLTYYIVNKNNKVLASSKFSLPKDTTKFARRTALLTGLKDGTYSLLIGSKKPFDVYIDDISVEKVSGYKDSTVGDFITNGNIGTAGVGNTAYDNGGIMIYTQAKPTGAAGSQPTIETIVSNEDYENIMFNTKREFIDTYIRQFEPYDKGLEEILNAPILEDDRLYTLTESLNTFTGNSIHYNVIEAGPGSTDHCVKPADELNVLYKQTEVKCDPIYPDLIIPPNYSTSDYDTQSKNSIPLQALQDGELKNEDILKKSFSFDYETLKDKEKKSKGKPINYNDPYPYDDRITELEQHFPKVKVDEIESRLYSCNHPGCPLAHPMAKNFAMLNDMQLAQSKKIEQRLVRIENILATVVRNMGRMGSRINVNCVYYGGQDVFGKYRTIRCLCDDRLHDGASVTIDQCMCCTRYEPIIGQIYDILDETGFNGSAILDDMQMSYMELEDFKNLNKVENRSSSFSYADVSSDPDKKPDRLIKKWKEEDKKAYLEQLKKELGSEEKAKKKLEESLESDYVFTMNWEPTEIDTQAPDVKIYPTEGIKSKYLNEPENENVGELDTSGYDPKIDGDVIAQIKEINSINRGEWVDTRDKADTTQTNNYTSEDFYFENFNANRTGYAYDNGLKGYIGLESSATGSGGSVANGLTGAECRSKIVEWVKKVCQEHIDLKATYHNSPRTVDPNDIKYYKGTLNGCTNPAVYDCTSLVSTAYKYAGLNSMYDKSCSQGTLVAEIVNNDGDMWFADEEGLAKALPGDVVVVATSTQTRESVAARKHISTTHAMTYLGKNENGEHTVGHASGHKMPPKAIRIDVFGPKHYSWGKAFFVRPKDLKEADAAASASAANGAGIQEVAGTIDGVKYVCALNKCRCTNYGTWDGSSGGLAGGGTTSQWANKAVAAHNMPYGTKIYIPELKGKVNSDGMFTVQDTGGFCFDFDVLTSKANSAISGNKSYKAYVVSWGSGKIAASFTKMKETCDKYYGPNKFKSAWNLYKTYGGSTMELLKFQQDDANIKNQPWY